MTPSLRTRISIALVVASVLPVGLAWLVIWATGASGSGGPGAPIDRVALFILVLAAFVGVGMALLFSSTLMEPLRRLLSALDGASSGEQAARVGLAGDDEIGRLADRYDRLTAVVHRRSREIEAVRAEIAAIDPTSERTTLIAAAAAGARRAFDMLDAEIRDTEPDALAGVGRVPGDPIEVRAVLRVGSHGLGTLVGTLRPAQDWDAGGQALLELYAAQVALAIWSAGRVMQ